MFYMEVLGERLAMETQAGLFSPEGLDSGTRFMLETVQFTEGDTVLDLGCGCGPVGIVAAKKLGADHVWMCDIDEAAVSCSRANAQANGVGEVICLVSDGLDALPEEQNFRLILSNPPYHADFSVPKKFIAQSFRRLEIGGTLYMVTKRRDWYENRIKAVFGGVKVHESNGYFVFEAQKRSAKPPQKKEKPAAQLSKKLQKKYAGRKK